MKRLLFGAVLGCLACHPAFAHDSTGCGLGSMAWRGQSGAIPQILAVTTNGFFGTQTFGISSGTSGCDPNGTITGGTRKMLAQFIDNNLEQYAFDAARGQGETLTTIAGILGVSEETVATASKENFGKIFSSENVESTQVTLALLDALHLA